MFTAKVHLKQCVLRCHVTKTENRYVEACARKLGLTLPQYMRQLALQGFTSKYKTLPPEVLAFRGQLLHLAGLLEPMSRKRMDSDELNALERAELKQAVVELNKVLSTIKDHFL